MKNKMYALPDNLIEVPPVSLQSFMLKYEEKYGGRLESPTAKKSIDKEELLNSNTVKLPEYKDFAS